MNKVYRFITVYIVLLLFMTKTAAQSGYISPSRMALSPATAEGYVVLPATSSLAKVDLNSEKLLAILPLNFEPSGLGVSTDGEMLFVTDNTAEGKLHLISSSTAKIISSIPVGAYPSAVCLDKEGTRAWVANRFSNDLSVIDLEKRKEILRLPMVREPKALALSPDGKVLAIANYLPLQAATDNRVAAMITLVDTEKNAILAHIPLRDGSHSLEDLCFSKEGDRLFVTHILSRYPFPTTQLERGWMNTNAVSLIDVRNRKYERALLLDDMYRGAANPCGVQISGDGEKLYVALSGTHELMILSLSSILRKMQRNLSLDPSNDLTFLNNEKIRIPLSGKGPRYLMVYENKVFVSDYFSGALSVVDGVTPATDRLLALGERQEPDDIRKGELYFADASFCFQNWQSCISCHPGSRTDGLNWDLLNDGIGNPKNTKSMLYTHVTPPCMITGIRPNAEIAVRAGIKHIQFAERSEAEAACIDLYLRSLAPVPSPYLEKGKLSKSAKRGKKIFEQTGCLDCHQGEYYTDGHKYNVGTGTEEYTDALFDTPTLKEVWRTAPYLYDGKAKTIREVITVYNQIGKHGTTSHLTEKEIGDLEQYVLSL